MAFHKEHTAKAVLCHSSLSSDCVDLSETWALRIHQLRTNRNQLRSLENYCSRNCLIEQNYDLKS